MSLLKIDACEEVFRNTTLFIVGVGDKGYLNLSGMSSSSGMSMSLIEARVLEMPHLHKEEFQVLLDKTLLGERKFNLATGL